MAVMDVNEGAGGSSKGPKKGSSSFWSPHGGVVALCVQQAGPQQDLDLKTGSLIYRPLIYEPRNRTINKGSSRLQRSGYSPANPYKPHARAYTSWYSGRHQLPLWPHKRSTAEVSEPPVPAGPASIFSKLRRTWVAWEDKIEGRIFVGVWCM